jgi:hypothetical protein
MAEQFFALLDNNEPKNPQASYSNDQNDSAGFMFPYKLASGIMQGNQGVGFGGVQIDSDNNRILIKNSADGSSIGMGVIPGTQNEFGFFSLSTDGKLIMKIVNGTKYTYNPDDSFHNVMQDGLLPDGSGGWAVAKTGQDVQDAF